jgi:integrase
MPVLKLTQRIVDDLVAAQPEARDVFYWDERMPGFAAKRKGGSGSVSFVVQWRDKKSGRSHRLALGDARKVSLDRARKAAKTRFEQIAAGDNPVQARRQYRESLTFAELVARYYKSEEWKRKSETTKKGDAYRLDHALIPFFAGKRITDITEEDTGRCWAALADPVEAAALAAKAGATRKVPRGGETGSRRTMRLLRALFAWAMRKKLMAANPASGLSLGVDSERESFLDEASYIRLWDAIERLRGQRTAMMVALDAIAIMAITGARKSEIQHLRWRHLDLEGRRIMLPPNEHKGGRKSRKLRIIPLADDAVAILSRYVGDEPKAHERDDYVFEGERPGIPVMVQRPWNRLKKAAELPDVITLHSLRHSVGSHLAMNGMTTWQVAKQLGHAQTRTAERYSHAADRALAELADKAAALVRPRKLRAVE